MAISGTKKPEICFFFRTAEVTALPMGMPQQLTNGNGAANHKWECRSDSQMGMPQRLTNGNAAATHKWECRSDSQMGMPQRLTNGNAAATHSASVNGSQNLLFKRRTFYN